VICNDIDAYGNYEGLTRSTTNTAATTTTTTKYYY